MLERNLVTSLLLYESIRTTKKRAKVVQPTVDRLINYAKSHPPHVAVRYANRIVTDKNASRKIMEVYCSRYADRASGLSRIIPVGARKGDGAEIVDIVLIDAVIGKPQEEEVKKPAKKKEAPKEEKKETVAAKAEAQEKKKPAAKKKASTTKKKS
jgi:large subunit ribosomal protein L17